MAEKTNGEKLKFIISHAAADVNLCAAAYQLIKGSANDERAKIFEEFVVGYRSSPTDCSMELPEVINKVEEQSLMKRYRRYVDQKIKELIDENLDEKNFYKKLIEFIVSDEMLQDPKAGAIAIFDCVIDPRFPYHWVDVSKALSMSQEKYLEILHKIGSEDLKQIDRVLKYGFNQKTERAAVLLALIEDREDYEERVVMMTRLLAHMDLVGMLLNE